MVLLCACNVPDTVLGVLQILSYLIPLTTDDVDTIISPIWKLRKLRLREIK